MDVSRSLPWMALLGLAAWPVRTLAQSETDYTIGLNTLILSSAYSAGGYPELVLGGYGTNYDLIFTTEQSQFMYPACPWDGVRDDQGTSMCGMVGMNRTLIPDINLKLLDPVSGQPTYNVIVQTGTNLGYVAINPNTYEDMWVDDSLGDIQRQLEEYCQTYSVRRVILDSNPSDIGSEALVQHPGRDSDNNTIVTFVRNDFTAQIHNMVRLDAMFQIGTENEFSSSTYWITPGMFDPIANTDGAVQPIMNMKYTGGNGTVVEGVGAVIKIDPITSTETMYFFFGMNSEGLHGAVLAHVWFPWATKGLFLGQRRLILDTQIDDVYLDTLNVAAQAKGDVDAKYRMTSLDLEHHMRLQNNLNTALPILSNFTIQMAFNGKGYLAFNDEYEPNLNPSSLALFDKFLWLSHTWYHIDMYCFQSNCFPPTSYVDPQLARCVNKEWLGPACEYNNTEPNYPQSGYTSYEYILYEVRKNQIFADSVLEVSTKSKHERAWSPRSLVTPGISGLNSTEAVRAILASGIHFVVGDNSLADLKPEVPWHMADAKVSVSEGGRIITDKEREHFGDEMEWLYGYRSAQVIPRFSTRLNFDTSTPEQLSTAFNARVENSIYGRPLNTTEIIALDAVLVANNLFHLRSDPYMFHQGNLRVFNDTLTGEHTSLLEMWIKETLKWVMDYTSFPVQTFKMDDLAEQYHLRKERDVCSISGNVQYVNGKPANLAVTSSQHCVAKLTHTITSGSQDLTPQIPIWESYGEDKTYDLAMNGAVTIVQLGSVSTLNKSHANTRTQSYDPRPHIRQL
eukprot:CFRG7076T1